MKIDEEGLQKLAQRFMKRREIKEMGLSMDDVKCVLLEHAKRCSGCVNCVFSAPYHGKFSWTTRHCILGLSQSDCKMRKPIISDC
jgi:hypothetical protein